MIPIPMNVRSIVLCIVTLAGLGVVVLMRNSKEKREYQKLTGTITHYTKELGNLPHHDKGSYRYLKTDNYPYFFEIYEPNSAPTTNRIDDLKTGDTVDIFYYETANTKTEELNRFAQFIDKNSQPHFIRNGFQKQLGLVLVGLCFAMIAMVLILWRKGKLPW